MARPAVDPTVAPDRELSGVLRHTICGVECENSPWKTEKMPDAKSTLPLKKLNVIAPRIWVKEEDTDRLTRWSRRFRKPVVVVQVFFDRAYMVLYRTLISRARRIRKVWRGEKRNDLQKRLGVILVEWPYPDSRTGRTTNKLVYTCHHTLGVCFGAFSRSPRAVPNVITEKNGKMMPYVKFAGGSLRVSRDGLKLFRRVWELD